MTSLGNKIWRDLKPDAQAFDAVRITTVPRYKTSGLSGDEWRISAHVELLRKNDAAPVVAQCQLAPDAVTVMRAALLALSTMTMVMGSRNPSPS